ncbi:hypothetical protein PoB_005791500 [Plakobranchus ocellatus]|uniref:Uncharacterized protein n=1 Tax=Plakobranchus ocellatus TaxID=259542 RepID=A0AAV4CIJ2_9GAST|nr:hypothetical protein PoB_005791500 [Plakobranchus ocellatus]
MCHATATFPRHNVSDLCTGPSSVSLNLVLTPCSMRNNKDSKRQSILRSSKSSKTNANQTSSLYLYIHYKAVYVGLGNPYIRRLTQAKALALGLISS